jgi:hypothetical protein
MTHWFYAVLTETAGWYSTAVRARDLDAARAKLQQRYPHATIHSIEH